MNLQQLHQSLLAIYGHLTKNKNTTEYLPSLTAIRDGAKFTYASNVIYQSDEMSVISTLDNYNLHVFMNDMLNIHNVNKLAFVIQETENWFGVVIAEGDKFKPIFRMSLTTPLTVDYTNIDLPPIISIMKGLKPFKFSRNEVNGKVEYTDIEFNCPKEIKDSIEPYLKYISRINDNANLILTHDGKSLICIMGIKTFCIY